MFKFRDFLIIIDSTLRFIKIKVPYLDNLNPDLFGRQFKIFTQRVVVISLVYGCTLQMQ